MPLRHTYLAPLAAAALLLAASFGAAPSWSQAGSVSGRASQYRLCSYDPFVSQAFIPSPHPPVRPVAASITRRPAAPRAAHSASWRTNDPLPAPGAHPAVVPADVRPHRLISGGGRASEPRCPIHGPSAGCPKGWDQAGYAAWRARHRRRSRIRSGARAAVLRRPLPRYGGAPDHAAAAFSSAPGGGLPVWM